MDILYTRSARIFQRPGVLFRRRAANESLAIARAAARPIEVSRTNSRGKHWLAFAGIYLFTLLMYSRPHEVMPALFWWLPLPKIVAISSILIYVASKLYAGEALIIWTLELKMMALLWALGLLLTPL